MCLRWVAFKFFVSLFVVNKCVLFVKVFSFVLAVTRPLSAFVVKLLSGMDADCTVKAILPLMLSLTVSNKSR